jgi:hypothetical protein
VMAISIAFCSPVEHSAAGWFLAAMVTARSSRWGPERVRPRRSRRRWSARVCASASRSGRAAG